MFGKGCCTFYRAVVMTMLERLIADWPSLRSPLRYNRTCSFNDNSPWPYAGTATGRDGFCMVLGGERGDSLETASTFYCVGYSSGKLKSILKTAFC
jgi:hypothetical protein